MLKYRTYINDETQKVLSYEVVYKETSLLIRAEKNFKTKILQNLISLRKPIENYINKNPEFLTSLKPIKPKKNAPEIIKKMCSVSQKTGVGPMSAVAGTIAELLGYKMLNWIEKENLKKFLVIENGGDIFAYVDEPITIGIYAGENSPFTGKLSLNINIFNQPLGICTSSGTVGHSLSFGNSDAVIIISNSASFSDTLATATGNLVKIESDIKSAVEFAKSFNETIFVCIIKNKTVSFWSKTDKIIINET
ncbi:MAG: UPF0280 family protein [Endomicrobiia bacterium]